MTIVRSHTEHAQRAEPYANDALRLRLSGQVLEAPSFELELRSIMAERDAQTTPAAVKNARRTTGKHARRKHGELAP